VLGRTPDASGHWGDLSRHPENESVPGVVVLRVESGLFFANADHVRSAVKEHAAKQGVHAVVLDAETIPFVDVTAAEMIEGLRGELAREGVTLLLARDIGQVRDVLQVTQATDGGTRAVFRTVEAAVEAATRSGNAGATESTQGE
jgi:anti-anti-sigma factor